MRLITFHVYLTFRYLHFERLSSKHEALNSNPSTTKKQKENFSLGVLSAAQEFAFLPSYQLMLMLS
jgi:hypothetical protein